MKIIYIFLVLLSGIAVSCNSQGNTTEIEKTEAVRAVAVTDTVPKSRYVIDIKPEYIENLTQAEKERLDTILQLFDGIASIRPESEAQFKEMIHANMDTLKAVAELFKSLGDTVRFEMTVSRDSNIK